MLSKKPIATATLLVAGLVVVALFQNCGSSAMGPGAVVTAPDSAGSPAVTATEFKAMSQELEDLNKQDLTCSSDADCEPVAVGSRACGGPQRYLVASNKNAAHSRVLQLARILSEEEARLNAVSGAVSTCLMMLPPETACKASVCSTK